MAAPSSTTIRRLYHARTLVLSAVGIVGLVVGAVFAGDLGRSELGAFAMPLVVATIGLLGFVGWLGWIDYRSVMTLAIDARGVSFRGRIVPWREIRSVSRATGAFRLALTTDAGKLRFQLLVLAQPIQGLKVLVTEASKAGAKVEPYLARLAEHVEEDPE